VIESQKESFNLIFQIKLKTGKIPVKVIESQKESLNLLLQEKINGVKRENMSERREKFLKSCRNRRSRYLFCHL